MEFRTFETAFADPRDLELVRSLMDRAFDGDFSDDDWEHSIGGWHVVALEGGAIVAHAALVSRPIEADGRMFDTGYVEAVATEPSRQGRGLGTAVMEVVGELVVTRYELGALSTGEHHFYERLGWERWRGPTFVRHGDQLIRTEGEDDGIMVLRVGRSIDIDLGSAISCGRRRGDDW
jgi:aminoglycoside 2'-N-acetyltransferase I